MGSIMKKYNLISNYTVKQYKPSKTMSNEEKIENTVNRNFKKRKELEVVVSDISYVNVNGKWHYICLIMDLFNREIIEYSAGKIKDIKLINKAFSMIKKPLNQIQIFSHR